MIGYERTFKPFNLSFYEQVDIPYDYSFDYFENPSDIEKQSRLLDHLRKDYKVYGDFQLVHNQSSYGKADLKINPELQTIYVDKSTDIFKNIFIYKKAIEEAKTKYEQSFFGFSVIEFHHVLSEAQKNAFKKSNRLKIFHPSNFQIMERESMSMLCTYLFFKSRDSIY